MPVNHQYGSGNTRWNNETLVDGDIVYTGQYTNSIAVNASFTIGTDGSEGFANATTNGSGVVTVVPVNHSYSSGGYYYSNETLADGDLVYTGQYTFELATGASFTVGTDGVQGFGNATTDGSGVATVTLVNHPYGSGSTWWNNETLADGDIVYYGQYTNSTAPGASFTLGDYTVTTDENGVATLTLSINHPYSTAGYYHNNETLADGDTLYLAQNTNEIAVNASFTIGIDGSEGFANVTTNGSGVVTVVPVNHPYSAIDGTNATSWWDNEPLISGDFIYQNKYTLEKRTSGSFTIGTDGVAGFADVTTNSDGTATVVAVNHQYSDSSGTYFWDNANLQNGDLVYSGQYTKTLASDGVFTIGVDGEEGFADVSVGGANGAGVASLMSVDHSYSNSTNTYWWDSSTLTDGEFVYTGRYTKNKASEVTFNIGSDGEQGFASVTVNSGGVADVSLVNHSVAVSPPGQSTFYIDSPITEGSSVYLGQFTNSTVMSVTGTYSVGTEGTAGYGILVIQDNTISEWNLVDHPNVYLGGLYATDEPLPTSATIAFTIPVYVGRYSNTKVASSSTFRVGGLEYVTDYNGSAFESRYYTGIEQPDPVLNSGNTYTGYLNGTLHISAGYYHSYSAFCNTRPDDKVNVLIESPNYGSKVILISNFEGNPASGQGGFVYMGNKYTFTSGVIDQNIPVCDPYEP